LEALSLEVEEGERCRDEKFGKKVCHRRRNSLSLAACVSSYSFPLSSSFLHAVGDIGAIKATATVATVTTVDMETKRVTAPLAMLQLSRLLLQITLRKPN